MIFFSRVRVDSQEYGMRSGYAAGPVPFTFGLQHYYETEESATRPRDFQQDTLSLTAQNHRKQLDGTTRLSYNLTDFTRHDDGFNTTRGLAQNLNLTDNEQFGGQKQAQLTSLLNYSSLSQTLVPTDQLLAEEDLHLQHTRRLDSFYTYMFNASSAGDSDANTHDLRAGLNYQWLPDFDHRFRQPGRPYQFVFSGQFAGHHPLRCRSERGIHPDAFPLGAAVAERRRELVS